MDMSFTGGYAPPSYIWPCLWPFISFRSSDRVLFLQHIFTLSALGVFPHSSLSPLPIFWHSLPHHPFPTISTSLSVFTSISSPIDTDKLVSEIGVRFKNHSTFFVWKLLFRRLSILVNGLALYFVQTADSG